MASDSTASTSPSAPPTNVRWLVFSLASATSFLLYLHRYTWGFVKADVAEEFGWDTVTLGVLDSCFLASYAVGQIPFGIVGDWFGPRVVLGVLIICWSLAMGVTGLATGVWTMGASRLAFGFAQSGCYPNLTKITKLWFPPTVRTSIQGWIASFFGRSGGAFSNFFFASILLAWWGMQWRGALYLLTAVGVVFGILFLLLFRNRPADHPWTNDAETKLVTADDPDSLVATRSKVRWSKVLRNRNMAWFLFQQFTSAFADNLYSLWIPMFLLLEKRVDLSSAGWMAAVPLLGGAFGGMAGGTLQNSLIVRTGNRRWVRSLIGCVGKVLAAVLMFVSLGFNSAATIVAFFFFVKFFGDWSQPTVWGTSTDIGGKNSASVFATVNTVGSFAGFVAGPVMGAIILGFSQNAPVDEVVRPAEVRAAAVDSESSETPNTALNETVFPLSQRGLLDGSGTAIVMDDGQPVASVRFLKDGETELTDIESESASRPTAARWNLNRGEVTITWQSAVTSPELDIQYEYIQYGNGWTALFISLSAIYLASAISWLFVDCTKKLED